MDIVQPAHQTTFETTPHPNIISAAECRTPTHIRTDPISYRAWWRARELVLLHGRSTMAFQILNIGMHLWFSPNYDAAVGYVSSGGFRVVAGAPIGEPTRLTEVVAAFEADARRHRQQVCYFGAQEYFLEMLTDRSPEAQLLLGAQPAWDPRSWPEIVKRKSSVRAQIARARNKHVSVMPWRPEQATNHSGLCRCLDEWLDGRGLPPMHFLVEPDTFDNLCDRRVYVAERDHHTVGFLIASPVPLRNGWLIEHMVRCGDAPNGTSELLLDAAMHHLNASGATYVTLGLSPLSQRANVSSQDQPIWLRWLLDATRSLGQRFYNFDGLDAFKAKFLPDYWEPLYAITSERRISPRTIYAIAGAFGGTSPFIFVSHGLLRAFGKETLQLGKRMIQVGSNA